MKTVNPPTPDELTRFEEWSAPIVDAIAEQFVVAVILLKPWLESKPWSKSKKIGYSNAITE